MKQHIGWDPQVKQEEWISLYQSFFEEMQDAERVIEEVIKLNPEAPLMFRIMPVYSNEE